MHPDIEGLSDIQDTQDMIGSRTTGFMSPRSGLVYFQSQTSPTRQLDDYLLDDPAPEEQFCFFSCRDYVERTLATWGMHIGAMHESQENKKTLQCLMKIISQKNRDNELREKLKDSLAESEFQKKKYQSLLEQAKLGNDQKNKKIGQMENSFEQLRAKLKRIEQQSKKQKEDDKKMIGMLKSKNEHAMHQVKKKDQEIGRVKEQMKRNIGDKNAMKSVTFEVYEAAPTRTPGNLANDTIKLMSQRYEGQRKTLIQENILLKEKLYEIRNQIVSFAQWIDVNVFGQSEPNYQNKLLVNHNLLFRKESIVDEFNSILEDARSGIKQVMEGRMMQAKQNTDNNSNKSSRNKIINLAESKKLRMQKETRESLPFQRKTQVQPPPARTPVNPAPPAVTTMKLKPATTAKPNPTGKDIPNRPPPRMKEQVVGDSDLSMISYISMSDPIEGNKKFDKWDFLINPDNDDDYE